MNAQLLARSAYASALSPTRTERGTEYEVIARITRRLKTASTENFSALAAALNENRTLWSVLAADVLSSENSLPNALRAQIFYLSEFTRRHTSRVLGGTATIDALVEINTAIMRGLRNEGEAP